jgi:hypothetical protein
MRNKLFLAINAQGACAGSKRAPFLIYIAAKIVIERSILLLQFDFSWSQILDKFAILLILGTL